jgi:phosphoribosylformimino-5-aminoimidazole carboxamide ribotide isomerase
VIDFLPAIDLRGGKAVRLVQGDFSRETIFADDPLAVARGFASAGARWLHVVDLDGARAGHLVHGAVIRAIVAETGLAVELGGGIRDDDSAATALSWGVSRVVVGTAAFDRPEWFRALVRRYPGRVALGVDARAGRVAVQGWLAETDIGISDAVALANDAGAAALIFTEIRRDGAMQGPDLVALGEVLAAARVPVIASGGVHCLDDLRRLRALSDRGPLAGVIVGRAVYDKAIDVAAALAVLAT